MKRALLENRIHYYHDNIFFFPKGSWKGHNEVHANIILRLWGDRKRSVETLIEMTPSHVTNGATWDHLMNIPTHLEPIKMILEYLKGLLMTKWPAKAPLIAFLIIKSFRGLLGIQNLFSLKRKPSYRVKEPKLEGLSTITSLKSYPHGIKFWWNGIQKPWLQGPKWEHIFLIRHWSQHSLSHS